MEREMLDYNKEIFVEQHSTAGHMINCKDGGIGLELRERTLFPKMKGEGKVGIELVNISVCFTATHRSSIQLW